MYKIFASRLTNPASSIFPDLEAERAYIIHRRVKKVNSPECKAKAFEVASYNEEQIRFIDQRGDYIIDNFEKLKKIVDLAFDQPDKKAIAHFGIVDAATLRKIKNSIPNLPEEMAMLFADNRDYSVATTLDGIRHIVKEKSLSRQDVIDYLDRLADTIVEYDEVDFHYYTRRGRKKQGSYLEKTFLMVSILVLNLYRRKNEVLCYNLFISIAWTTKKGSLPILC